MRCVCLRKLVFVSGHCAAWAWVGVEETTWLHSELVNPG